MTAPRRSPLDRLRLAPALLAGAVLVVLAIGTTRAQADVVCEEPLQTIEAKEICGAEYPEQEEFIATAKSVVLKSTLEEVCESKIVVKTTKDLGEGKGLEGEVTSLAFSNCSGACATTAALRLPYKATAKATTAGNGTDDVTNGGSGNPGVELKGCIFGLSCVFEAEKLSLEFKGGAPASVVAKGVTLKRAGGSALCGEQGTLSATYTFTQPASGKGYLAQVGEPVTLCKKAQAPCPWLERYGTGTELVAGLQGSVSATFKLNITEGGTPQLKEPKCGLSAMTGKTTRRWALPLPGEIETLVFESCGGSCTITAVNLHFAAEIDASGLGNGTLVMRSNGTGPPGVKLSCGTYICTYTVAPTAGITTAITGGSPALLAVDVLFDKKVAGSTANCGPDVRWEGAYSFSEPKAGGVSKMWVEREGL